MTSILLIRKLGWAAGMTILKPFMIVSPLLNPCILQTVWTPIVVDFELQFSPVYFFNLFLPRKAFGKGHNFCPSLFINISIKNRILRNLRIDFWLFFSRKFCPVIKNKLFRRLQVFKIELHWRRFWIWRNFDRFCRTEIFYWNQGRQSKMFTCKSSQYLLVECCPNIEFLKFPDFPALFRPSVELFRRGKKSIRCDSETAFLRCTKLRQDALLLGIFSCPTKNITITWIPSNHDKCLRYHQTTLNVNKCRKMSIYYPWYRHKHLNRLPLESKLSFW